MITGADKRVNLSPVFITSNHHHHSSPVLIGWRVITSYSIHYTKLYDVIQGARLVGANMIVGVDTNPAKRALAEKFGMTHFVNPKEAGGDLVAHLVNLTKGGADYSFDVITSYSIHYTKLYDLRPLIIHLSPFSTAFVFMAASGTL